MSVGFLRYYAPSFDNKPGLKLRTMFAVAQLYDLDFFQFSPKDVDVEKKVINGLFWDAETESYVRRETPYPDIVDDQFSFRRKDPELYDELKEHCYMTFMPLGRKTQIFNRIAKTDFAKYLIETHHFKDIEDIDSMLGEGKAVIIKPNNGGRGNDIFKLHKNEDNTYSLKTGEVTTNLTLDELKSEYYSKFEERFIVQPFVDSLTDNGNPFDIRMHLRRAKDGKWSFALVYPRIGSSKGIISNVAKGGTISYDVKSFLKQEIGDDWTRISKELYHLAKKFPAAIQSFYRKRIDSLALDVAIHRSNGNEMKFFEVNTYPGVTHSPFESSEASIQFYRYLLNRKEEGKL